MSMKSLIPSLLVDSSKELKLYSSHLIDLSKSINELIADFKHKKPSRKALIDFCERLDQVEGKLDDISISINGIIKDADYLILKTSKEARE